MHTDWIKPTLIKGHRWIGLTLAPLFLLIALSGAVLAIKPIIQQTPSSAVTASAPPVETTQLISLLERIDPMGTGIEGFSVDPALDRLTVRSRDSVLQGSYALGTGQRIDTGQEDAPFDLFAMVEHLHKELLIGFDFPVELASYLMLAIVAVAPFLAWPRVRNNLMGWHRAVGWCLLPLLLLLPLTGVLMSLHVGMPELPRMSQPGASLPLSQALRNAAVDYDLKQLTTARRFRGGTVLLSIKAATGERMLAVTDRKVSPLDPADNLVKQLHEGTWAGALSGSLNLLGATAISLLILTGVISWARRTRQPRLEAAAGKADILIAYASQTGTAARLAQTSLEVLKRAGARVALASLGTLLPHQMLGYRHNLLLVSSTGEGDVPDTAQAFLRKLNDSRLSGGRFTLLALGDRRYRHFCGGAERLRSALLSAGAVETLPMQRIDGRPDKGWQAWLASIADSLKLSLDPSASHPAEAPLSLTLLDRQRLDAPTADGREHPSYKLLLQSDTELDFKPGDLLQISPDGDARSRSYSIGSSSEITPGRLRLTVALHQWRDAQGVLRTGQASGMLCEQLQLTDRLDARLVRHADFHAPEDSNRPLILIATGCGIAPFIGFIEQREHAVNAGPVWLIYGNRWRDVDYLYRETLEAQHHMGVISRLDTLFSRDQADPVYVTHSMREQGAELVRWLLEEDAALYVCGRGSTLGEGVDQALREILAQHTPHDSETIESLIGQWGANGKLRRDLFD